AHAVAKAIGDHATIQTGGGNGKGLGAHLMDLQISDFRRKRVGIQKDGFDMAEIWHLDPPITDITVRDAKRALGCRAVEMSTFLGRKRLILLKFDASGVENGCI